MPTFNYVVSDFTAFSKIKSADVNSRFSDIKTFFNTTKLDSTNVQQYGLSRDRLAAGTVNAVVINDASGHMIDEAQLAASRGGTGQGSYTTGDILYASGASALSKLGIGASGTVLGGGATPSWVSPTASKNYLLNSDFSLWQRGLIINVSNGASSYVADRWYIKNSLGGGTTPGVCQMAQIASPFAGALYSAECFITTAPVGTGINANGLEVYQTLPLEDSQQLYNQTASLSVLVQAASNVTQVGLQFFYATSEAKVNTAIGSEVLTTINSAGYTQCVINGQALGTSMTASGVIGVRIRPTAVSTGNLYDAGNGIYITQAILTSTPTAVSWHKQHPSEAAELAACQRYYQKSYPVAVPPATTSISTADIIYSTATLTTSTYFFSHRFPIVMRTNPTVTVYSFNGNTGTTSNDSGTDYGANTGSVAVNTSTEFVLRNTSGSSATVINSRILANWTADAEI